MADTVRYLMEEMIPELEDLEKKGYFSRAEVKAIAQKRQDFEYSLKRRAALKRDFLRCVLGGACWAQREMLRSPPLERSENTPPSHARRYIDYELKVEELRRHRRKARGIKGERRRKVKGANNSAAGDPGAHR